MFEDRTSAEAAIADLEITGLDSHDICLFAHDPVASTVAPILPISGSPGGVVGYSPGLGAALLTLKIRSPAVDHLETRITGGEALVAVAGGERTAIVRTVLERNGGEIVAH